MAGTVAQSNLWRSFNQQDLNVEGAIVYYLWASLLVLAAVAAWIATFFTLPGTWVIVGLSALFALWYGDDAAHGIRWSTVAVLAGLAAVGELVESAAGAAGAAKRGASRRAMMLAVVGAVVGSIVGGVFALPIFLIGPVLGAVGGGAAGAFVGAYAGEVWKGKSSGESLETGKAALLGRLLGTVGKLALGAVMVVVVTIDALF